MAHLRITRFAGILPEISARNKPAVNAQIAHNCLLADGTLRPQAAWVRLQSIDAGFEQIYRGMAFDRHSDFAFLYASFDPITLEGEPFGEGITVGASPNSLVNWYYTGDGLSPRTVSVYGDGVNGALTYSRTYNSNKPVNRMYALSRVRRIGRRSEEGSLIPISGQSATDVLYEGDLVTVEMNATALDDGATHIRLYRTISGLDTGENVTNTLDTEWHLVDELPLVAGNVVQYTDGDAATALPLDVYYAGNFHPPELPARYFGMSESGWFVAASINGDVQISERYMHHAWPVDNWLRLSGEEITDIAVHMDNVYVGTLQRPYVIALASGEAGLQAAATPFPELLPCLPGSMTPAPGGALYASGQGLVAVSREGARVVSRDVVNAGDTIYTKVLSDGRVSTAKIANTSYGTYYQGRYIGFCEGPPIDDGLFLTTTLYPVETQEALASSAYFAEAQAVSVVLDGLANSAAFISGEIRPILQTYEMPTDKDGSGENGKIHLSMSAEFVEGELTTILRTTDMQDAIAPRMTLAQATLADILVRTDMDDALAPRMTLIAGNLI